MFTTNAIVIKEVDYRDNDKMLTLFSPEYGRIDTLSRGCKKQGSKLLASSQMFNCGEYRFCSKNDKNYHAGCEIKHTFYNLRDDYEKLFTASFFVEFINAFIVHNQADKKLYSLLLNCLFSLENEFNDFKEIIQFFLVKLSDIAGFRLSLDKCIVCDKNKKKYYLSFDDGGIICSDCIKGNNQKKKIYAASIEVLKQIYQLPSKNICEKLNIPYSKSLVDTMFLYIQDKSHLKIKSYNMLKQIDTI